MRIFIAAKPSLARAIADVLPQPHQKRGSCIACGGNDVVVRCAGDVLDLAEPEQTQVEITMGGVDPVDDSDDPAVPGSHDNPSTTLLLTLREGVSASITEVTIADERTTPPKRFTDAAHGR